MYAMVKWMQSPRQNAKSHPENKVNMPCALFPVRSNVGSVIQHLTVSRVLNYLRVVSLSYYTGLLYRAFSPVDIL